MIKKNFDQREKPTRVFLIHFRIDEDEDEQMHPSICQKSLFFIVHNIISKKKEISRSMIRSETTLIHTEMFHQIKVQQKKTIHFSPICPSFMNIDNSIRSNSWQKSSVNIDESFCDHWASSSMAQWLLRWSLKISFQFNSISRLTQLQWQSISSEWLASKESLVSILLRYASLKMRGECSTIHRERMRGVRINIRTFMSVEPS